MSTVTRNQRLEARALREVSLFARLSDATLARIAEVGFAQAYAPEEHILLEGEPCRAVYFVLEGEVRIYRVSREGREQVLVSLTAGQAFNTVPAFQLRGRNPANAVAVDDVKLYVLLKDDFLRLVQSCSDLAMAILTDFADRLSHLTNLVEGLALLPVQGRLARFLLDHAGATEGQPATPTAVTERWTQSEIAVHLGTVRDMIGRGLRAFQDAGLIRLDRGKIVVVDRKGLEEIAER